MTFGEVAKLAHRARVSLSSTGYYSTPKIHYDTKTHQGRPFYYFAYGAALSEVEVDTLTGEYRLRRVDILHDAGQSLNPAIDLGQVEGGFVQGMGWLTTEELWWDDKGHLRTHAPSTYKIPACGDIPAAFNVSLFKAGPQQRGRGLSIQGGGRAAADAGDRGVPGAARCDRSLRRRLDGAASRCAGDGRAGADGN